MSGYVLKCPYKCVSMNHVFDREFFFGWPPFRGRHWPSWMSRQFFFQFVLVTVTILNETDRSSTLLTGYWVIKAMIYGSQLIESGGQPMSLNVVMFLLLSRLLTRRFPWTTWIIPIQWSVTNLRRPTTRLSTCPWFCVFQNICNVQLNEAHHLTNES